MPKISSALFAVGLGSLILSAPLSAQAATPHWSTTEIQKGSDPVKVRFCSGGTRTMHAGDRTTKNVCAFYWKYEVTMFVYVEPTGTELFDEANCGDSKWKTLTTKTDTSNTAMVGAYRIVYCV